MSIPLPETGVDDVPGVCPEPGFGLRALTRLALSQALRELADAAIALTPTFGEDDLQPGAYSAGARPLGVLYRRVRVLSALNDRVVLGAPWEAVDRHLGLPPGQAEEMYALMEKRWRAGDTAPWAPLSVAAEDSSGVANEVAGQVFGYPVDLEAPAALAGSLDRWCGRHVARARRDRARWWNDPGKPVSGGLPR